MRARVIALVILLLVLCLMWQRPSDDQTLIGGMEGWYLSMALFHFFPWIAGALLLFVVVSEYIGRRMRGEP